MEGRHRGSERGARHVGGDIVDGADALALSRHHDEAGVAQPMPFLRERGEHERGAGAPQGQERLARRGEDPADLLDDGAQFLEPPRRARATSGDLGIDPGIAEIRAVGDAQPAHPVVDPGEIIARLGRQGVGIAGVGTRQHVEERRRVAHAARHRPDIRQEAHRRGRIGRDPAERRLQPENAGEGRAGCGSSRRRRCRHAAGRSRRRRRRRRRRCCRPGCAPGSTGCG